MAKKAKQPKEPRLEDILFDCRDSLRGSASMTEKRDLLLTLVFIKFLYEKFKKQQEVIRAKFKGDEGLVNLMLTQKSAYEEDGAFYLDDKCRWDKLIEKDATSLAVELDNALTELNKIERLKGSVPLQVFTPINLEPRILSDVMNNVNKIDPAKFGEKDLIGRVYEYFLREFSFQMKDNKEEGEFYTPHSIVKLIASLIEPYDGTIGDPCCGTGGMFIQSMKLIESKGGNTRKVQVYGQESNKDTLRLAKMNLVLRGISFDLGVRASSSFTDDQHIGRTVDYVMANPPFNKKKWRGKDQLTNDARWSGYGVPPVSNANYAWILHILKKLDVKKGIAGFLLANGALDDDDTLAIRQKLIENDKVEAIIILPRNMFFSTDISVTLWILNNNKKARLRNGLRLRDRQKEVLFIDLRTWNQNLIYKKYVEFNDEQIERVCKIYKDWQTLAVDENGKHASYEVPELYRSVEISEIEENGWSLVPSRYIRFVDQDGGVDPTDILTESMSKVSGLCSKQVSNTENLLNSFKNIGFDYLMGVNNLADVIRSISDGKKAKSKEIGKYIEPIEERNNGRFGLSSLKGISIEKRFIDTKANMENVSLNPYYVVKPEEFAYVTVTSRNGERISIAFNDSNETYIVSSSYVAFRIKDKQELLPSFLFLMFTRPEFDRYARFNSWGSARETFSWEDMCRVKIPIPRIEVQRAIVDVFETAQCAKKIAEEADKQLKIICPALIQYVINN